MAISVVSFSFSRAAQPEARGPSFLLNAGSLYHILVSKLVSKLTDFLSSPSYIIVPSPTQSLEWHVWLSSSGNNCHAVHRSLSSGASVWLYRGILPCPILSAKPAYANGIGNFRVFGMACLAGSKVNIQHLLRFEKTLSTTFNIRTLTTINQLTASTAEPYIDLIGVQEHRYYHSKVDIKYHDAGNGWTFVWASVQKNSFNPSIRGDEVFPRALRLQNSMEKIKLKIICSTLTFNPDIKITVCFSKTNVRDETGMTTVTIPPRPPRHINFSKPFHFLAGDHLVVPIGVSHISLWPQEIQSSEWEKKEQTNNMLGLIQV